MATRVRPVGDEDERSDAREQALVILYEAETKAIAPSDVADAKVSPVDRLTRLLVDGVQANGIEIDDLISDHAKGWTLQRMPCIDRNILRIAVYELKGRSDVPVAVVINEAVELAKRFSTDDSGRFVNGVLSAIAPKVRVKTPLT
jgi:transcription antitermination protein NusB